MSASTGDFLWVTHQIGAEAVLKHELARLAPEYRFAFSRPGFMTFKRGEGGSAPLGVFPEVGAQWNWAFARSWGKTLAQVHPPMVPREAVRLAQDWAVRGEPIRLHVFERDAYAPGDEPATYFPGQRAQWMREEILKTARAFSASHEIFKSEPRAQVGDRVLDVIWVQEDLWFFGVHTHREFRSPHPGGLYPGLVPAEAPSRAYLKILEMLEWGSAQVQAGETAVEIGAAPGGAVWALLERGLRVYGVDPGAMHARVLAHPQFSYIPKTVSELERRDLPAQVDWLLLDMNAEPRTALGLLDPLLVSLGPQLRGVVLTLKLNLWKFANDVPRYLHQIQRGLPEFEILRAAQLSNHRQELGVIGLRRAGKRSIPARPRSEP